MKKAFLIPALAAGMLLTSCDGNTPNPGNGGGKYDDYPYSALTPEQQKEKLAGEADAVLSQLQGLQHSTATALVQSLVKCMDYSSTETEEIPDEVVYPDYQIFLSEQFRRNFWEENQIMVADAHGTFSWNADMQDFDYDGTTPTDKLVILLPASLESTANDGRIEMTAKGSGAIISNSYDPTDIYRYEIPASMNVVLSSNGQTAATINITIQGAGDIDIADKRPDWSSIVDAIDAVIRIDDYAITINGGIATDRSASADISLTKGSEPIIIGKIGGSVDWDFVEEYCINSSVDADGNYTCYEYNEAVYPMPEEIKGEINIGSNLAIEALCNVKAINEATDALYDEHPSFQPNDDRKAFAEKEAAIYNKHVLATLASRTDRSKIATLKWAALPHEDYTSWCDENGNCYDGETEYRYYCKPVLVFNDQTEISAETYFGEGFDAVIDQWTAFFESFY